MCFGFFVFGPQAKGVYAFVGLLGRVGLFGGVGRVMVDGVMGCVNRQGYNPLRVQGAK